MGRRPDGYHELRTIFQAISLHDTLNLSLVTPHGITLWKSNDPNVAGRSRESCVSRARGSIRREIGFRGGVHARLEKRIPVARGLGGGSSDAAAA